METEPQKGPEAVPVKRDTMPDTMSDTKLKDKPPTVIPAAPYPPSTEEEPVKLDMKPTTDSKSKPPTLIPSVPPAVPATGDAAPTPKLSNAQKKAQQKAEKAAKRAQAKVVAAAQEPKAGEKDGKGKGDSQGPPPWSGSSNARRMSMAQEAKPEPKAAVPESFSHLSMARRIPLSEAHKDAHPAIATLGQQMANFVVLDSIVRLQETLLALKQVINSYVTPEGNSFSRHFTSHELNPQIEYLQACRPMSFSMGNAIRWLKLRISKIDPDQPENEAKRDICTAIDAYIRERITVANDVIVDRGSEAIQDGDVVLTFGHHRLVEEVMVEAYTGPLRRRFEVIVIDEIVDARGQRLANALAKRGIKVCYYPTFAGLQFNLARSTKVMFGAEAMFSNGAMYASAGTADIAMSAVDRHLPVIGLCHSINFTDRVATDSATYNEIDPERHTDEGLRLLFDTTREKYITVVVTEVGPSPAKSVMCGVRRWEEM